MIINFSEYSANQRYHLMTQTIIPRPIAWALTESTTEQGQNLNIAPFSYFTAVSSKPAVLMISVGKKPNGDAKDTLVNVLKNKEMVIHIASDAQADLVTKTAATLAYGESELDAIKLNNGPTLSTVPFEGFSLPRLAQCDIAYGCKLYDIKELGDIPQTLIFVEVTHVYVNDNVIEMDDKSRIKVRADKVNPLARLGANEYASITQPFTKQRPE